jgi:hypothetical protein
MTRSALSNLQVRSNLLPEATCQQDIYTCSVFELNDTERRTAFVTAIPPRLKAELQAALFWGEPPFPELDSAWAGRMSAGLAAVVAAVEESPTEEDAFETLVLARLIYADPPGDADRVRAAEWDCRVRAVLERTEFGLNADIIEDRLESVLGRRLAGPLPAAPVAPLRPPPAPAPAAKLVVSPVVAAPAEPPVPLPVRPAPDLFAALLPASPPAPAVPPIDPGLGRVTQRWASLPDHVKQCILLLIDAAEKSAPPE